MGSILQIAINIDRKQMDNGGTLLQDHLEQCYDKMQQIAAEGYESVQDSASRSDTPTPSNVLDQHFGSTSSSEKIDGTSRRADKRRRTSSSVLSSAKTDSSND